jgi:hypothetical protein
MYPRCCRPATSRVHYTTSCNTQSSAPEDGQHKCPKHVELTGIINKPLLLHLVGCLYYLYQWCTVKQISENEIYLLIKYIKSVLWRVVKRLSYNEDARCLKVKWDNMHHTWRRGRCKQEHNMTVDLQEKGCGSVDIIPYPTAFPYGNGMVLHFYQQQESNTTKTVHKIINKGLKAYV